MKKQNQTRDQWSGRFGFIMAAAGSAVGLGNIWKFPYIVGQSGGGAFLVLYVGLVLTVGFTIILGEIAIGRATASNPYDAYEKLKPGFGFIGILGILSSFTILSFYSVIGGWILKYITLYFSNASISNAGDAFYSFIQSPVEPIFWLLLFAAICAFIVMRGISGGIEKASKIMMPTLFVMMVVVAIFGITLPNAKEGLLFYLKPDFSKVTWNTVVSALGQVFFSLSLGMGTLITYGSYLDKKSDIAKDSAMITVLDTIISLVSGLAIIPAVFSFGLEPTSGPPLLFITLPHVFENMPFGNILGIVFFLLVLFAAVTSAISLLEVSVSFLREKFKIGRTAATLIPAVLSVGVGIFASLSHGVLSNVSLLERNIFDFLSYVASDVLLPIGGLLMCIFIGYFWSAKSAVAEIEEGAQRGFRLKKAWSVSIRYIMPLALFVILIKVFIG